MTYVFTTTMDLPFAPALEEIDLHATFSEKLGEAAAGELGDYQIPGACNPELARKALSGDPAVGLLLPCNWTTVEAIDPQVIGDLSGTAAVTEVAIDAATRLQAALRLISRQGDLGELPTAPRNGQPGSTR